MARDDRNRGGFGGARSGGALRRWVSSTGQRVVCGHCRGTRRREVCCRLAETKTKLFGAVVRSDAAQKLRRDMDSGRCVWFVAENFIGRVVRRRCWVRCDARRRFWRALGPAGSLRLARLKVARTARPARALRANRSVGREVALNQPACQQSTAAFVDPGVEQLLDFLSQVGGEVQSRLLVGLQSRLRRTQKKFPIHFLLGVLTHGDPPNGYHTLPFY